VNLVHDFERARFRVLFGLSVDRKRADQLEQQALQRAPEHPLVQNHRARRAMPETDLPPPPADLAPAARSFLRGQIRKALDQTDGIPGARAQVMRGDLMLLLDAPDAADHFRQARSELGDLPPLLARLARCQLNAGDPEQARALCVDALCDNPLLGTARVLLRAALEACKQPWSPIPMRVPVRRSGDRLLLPKNVTDAEAEIWRAWWTATLSAPDEELPPGAGAHAALLASLPGAPLKGPTAGVLSRVRALHQAGLLPAYQWSRGLTHTNARAFKLWRRHHPDALRRLWTEGIVLLGAPPD
jgi:hypothetical protein